MTCAEFERTLPDTIDIEPNVDQRSHLRSCAICSDLVSDLDAISQQARLLQASEEPSPRVWNSIEIALRQEGIIREPGGRVADRQRFLPRWRPAWFLPLAAIPLIIFGLFIFQHGSDNSQTARQFPGTAAPAFVPVALNHDYDDNLRNVNSYIEDAEASVKHNPNDVEAQRFLINAYEQKAMIYELAENRTLR